MFDSEARYYTRNSDGEDALGPDGKKRRDKLDKRYSHPALHRKLLVPMVPGKSEHLLSQIFTSKSGASPGGGGIDMDHMQRGQPGHRIPTNNGFEVVQESDMDYINFMHRAEFGDHGFDNMTVYNDAMSDVNSIRTMSPGFPPSNWGSPANSRPGSPVSGRFGARPASPSPLALGAGGYRGTDYVPVMPPRSPGYGARPETSYSSYDYGHTDGRSETEAHLLSNQQPPGGSGGGGYFPPPEETYRGVHR